MTYFSGEALSRSSGRAGSVENLKFYYGLILTNATPWEDVSEWSKFDVVV